MYKYACMDTRGSLNLFYSLYGYFVFYVPISLIWGLFIVLPTFLLICRYNIVMIIWKTEVTVVLYCLFIWLLCNTLLEFTFLRTTNETHIKYSRFSIGRPMKLSISTIELELSF